MELWLSEDLLKALYKILVDIYRDTDYPITVGHNEGMINVCIERPLTDIYNIVPFPHFLHRAAVLMETITRFHPFADGNKRVGLLTTFYLLYWNGYDLTIPNDADQFTVEIALGHKNLNDILSWLVVNSKMKLSGIARNLFCSFLTLLGNNPLPTRLASLLTPIIVPLYPFEFFRRKMSRGKRTKLPQQT